MACESEYPVTEFDALIVGAGPAGSTVALNLAPTWRVALLERAAPARSRPGESLPPAARRLLVDMGLFDSFLAENHLPCHGNRSIWGGATPNDTDFLRDVDGHGWHLDRSRFDTWLRQVAVERGAVVLKPVRVDAIDRIEPHWLVRLATPDGPREFSTSFLVDCGGRMAPVTRHFGVPRNTDGDRLICGWIVAETRSDIEGFGRNTVEAVEDGWWYTAPIADGQRVLAFFTDPDLTARRPLHAIDTLLERAKATAEIARIIAASDFHPFCGGVSPANTAFLVRCAGEGWIAAGDASVSFDPISSQGLLHAFFTGLAAAEAVDRCLAGTPDALDLYQRVIDGIILNYRRHLADCYGAETRWPMAPFWRRRAVHGSTGSV
jgi:flavin-dependent dehydrogenase